VDVEEARLLAMEPTWPAILLTRTVVDGAGRPIEFARDVSRGDRASFRVGAQLELHDPLR
jgi:DNA-binding GntR family transcriptional regulator